MNKRMPTVKQRKCKSSIDDTFFISFSSAADNGYCLCFIHRTVAGMMWRSSLSPWSRCTDADDDCQRGAHYNAVITYFDKLTYLEQEHILPHNWNKACHKPGAIFMTWPVHITYDIPGEVPFVYFIRWISAQASLPVTILSANFWISRLACYKKINLR